ncbi:divalent-cation tolerance protein CutA [Kribbella qitaiheensis]|uniref:Divalent-cation tolerance protein CutA n=1 Tax=Kribbella qitaiheensis TaxID=1544730 RepID=A0A7G6X6Q1_9ACTN|nr:divalent-cation tolerance protein CutA [Kribbella qitaiheensis]QNE21916.1 divalent-cation tolerance protein CutA [Kribbella qitaiheensis]
MTPTDHVVALTTTPTAEEASKLAQGLVDARLAACVQISSPITAVYRWQEKVWTEPEWQLWIKTATDKRDDLVNWLDEHHSGEVPELIFLPITDGSDAYLSWITEQTR